MCKHHLNGTHILVCFTSHLLLIFSEVDKVTDGIGYKLGNMVQSFVSLIAGYVIAFIYCWQLSLVLAALFPVMILLGSMMSKVCVKPVFHLATFFARTSKKRM
jgi:ABC-type multidrug transport system fused ATPase/permease subunit